MLCSTALPLPYWSIFHFLANACSLPFFDLALYFSQHQTLAEPDGTWLRRIEQRAADVTAMHVDEQESIQIVRYQPGQKYSYHTDYVVPPQVRHLMSLHRGWGAEDWPILKPALPFTH